MGGRIFWLFVHPVHMKSRNTSIEKRFEQQIVWSGKAMVIVEEYGNVGTSLFEEMLKVLPSSVHKILVGNRHQHGTIGQQMKIRCLLLVVKSLSSLKLIH